MTTRDVGDRVDLRHLVYDASETLTNATVVLTVTDPAGTTSTPSVTNSSTGTYDASFSLDSAGTWFWVWAVSGAVVDVETGSVLAADPGPLTYASLADLKSYLGITDTTQDSQLLDSLVTASRGIEHICGRRFYPDQAATARVFKPRDAFVADVDDFWTSTGLIVKVDTGDDATFATTLTAADYELQPFNGINDGEPGWPYFRIVYVTSRWPCNNQRDATVQVTAKWGWAAIPGPVKQACVYLAEETFKLKGSPFGVAASDQFGPIRMRDNPKVLSMLAPYRRYPVLVG